MEPKSATIQAAFARRSARVENNAQRYKPLSSSFTGKLKRSFNSSASTLSRCLTLPRSLHACPSKDNLSRFESSSELRRSRGSRGSTQRFEEDQAESSKNEDWDFSNSGLGHRNSRFLVDNTLRLSGTTPRSSPRSSLKSTTQIQPRKLQMHVTFTVTHTAMRSAASAYDDASMKWHTPAEDKAFLQNAIDRARAIDETMKYVSSIEATYNSSTGLTSPRALKEYFACPEEVVGIEHLLGSQKRARESLRSHHSKVLFDEQQRRRKQAGPVDIELLALRLKDSSTISAHMAQERASYVALLD